MAPLMDDKTAFPFEALSTVATHELWLLFDMSVFEMEGQVFVESELFLAFRTIDAVLGMRSMDLIMMFPSLAMAVEKNIATVGATFERAFDLAVHCGPLRPKYLHSAAFFQKMPV